MNRLRLFALASAVSLLAVVYGRGEGIPVDPATGKVTVPHEIVTLSEAQIEEVETIGSLTLLPEQWKKLRAIGSQCPKRFDLVLPVTHKDCSCDVGYYAIALSRDKVAITREMIEGLDYYGMESEADERKTITVRADRRGEFYHRGVLVPFERLLASVQNMKGKSKENDPVFLIVEMPVGVTRDTAALKPRIDALYSAAKLAGVVSPADMEAAQAMAAALATETAEE